MSKNKVIPIIIGIIAVLIIIMSLGLTGFLSVYNMSVGYCAAVGVSKLADRELQMIQNNTENPTLFLDLTDNDLGQIPKLREALDKVANLVKYNDIGRIIITPAEAKNYHEFLAKKFEQQYNSKPRNELFFFVYYNDKTYVVDGLILTDSPYDLELSASLYPPKTPESITITDDDLESIPKIKKAIDEIGTYEVSPYASVGVPEDEQTRIQKWFEKKYKEQYGVDGSTSYFRYNGKIYSAGFSIC